MIFRGAKVIKIIITPMCDLVKVQEDGNSEF